MSMYVKNPTLQNRAKHYRTLKYDIFAEDEAPGEGFEPSGPLQVTSCQENVPGLRPPRLGDPGNTR
jgi:hypothetical protein